MGGRRLAELRQCAAIMQQWIGSLTAKPESLAHSAQSRNLTISTNPSAVAHSLILACRS